MPITGNCVAVAARGKTCDRCHGRENVQTVMKVGKCAFGAKCRNCDIGANQEAWEM